MKKLNTLEKLENKFYEEIIKIHKDELDSQKRLATSNKSFDYNLGFRDFAMRMIDFDIKSYLQEASKNK